jgi:hypothetical protein
MRRLPALAALLLAAPALACPNCAASTTAASGGTGIWWIVGAFLLVPPAVALAVALAVRRELKG